MSIKKIIGIAITLLPFIAVFVISVEEIGFINTLKVFGSAAVIAVLFIVGVTIMGGD